MEYYNINATVKGQYLTVDLQPVVASGGKNCNTATFSFDDTWFGFAKTAIFYRSEGTVYRQLLTDDSCVIPHEVLTEKGTVYIGVYGISGSVTRTATLGSFNIRKGAITTGTTPPDPTPSVYEQIIAAIGDLDDLETEDKSSLVAAINEAAQRGGGTGDHTELENRDAADQHPISAITGLENALDGKQPTIEDLDDIREGAELGATALQSVPYSYRTAAEQDAKDNIFGWENKDSFATNYVLAANVSEITEGTVVQKNKKITGATLKNWLKSFFAELSHSHDYQTDISNKPIIGNAPVKIKVNGTQIAQFQLNDQQETTVNISVPTISGSTSEMLMKSSNGNAVGAGLTPLQIVSHSPSTPNYAYPRYNSGNVEWVAADLTPTSGSSNPITSGAVHTALAEKQSKVTANGLLKGDGNGTVSAAVPGTDYQTPLTTEDAELLEIDDTPTANSNNLVKSGGIKTYVDTQIAAAVGDIADLLDAINGEVI